MTSSLSPLLAFRVAEPAAPATPPGDIDADAGVRVAESATADRSEDTTGRSGRSGE